MTEVFADILRRSGRPVILAANKAEGQAAEAGLIEAWELGLGEPLALSAEHGEGMAELPCSPPDPDDRGGGADETAANPKPMSMWTRTTGHVREITAARPLRIAVVGRPNAGKSTLINRILGEDRLLTGPEAGITRDAIAVPLDWDGTPMRIFDTAGMRKRPRCRKSWKTLGRRRPARGEIRRGRGGPAGRRDPLRDPGPAHRRPGRARGPRRGRRGQQVGPRAGETGQAPRAAAGVRNAPAAAQGRAARHRVGGDRQGARPAPRRDPEGARRSGTAACRPPRSTAGSPT
jgi:hypothetical protein